MRLFWSAGLPFEQPRHVESLLQTAKLLCVDAELDPLRDLLMNHDYLAERTESQLAQGPLLPSRRFRVHAHIELPVSVEVLLLAHCPGEADELVTDLLREPAFTAPLNDILR